MYNIQLYCGDVIEILAEKPDESYVACFCDPPYGLKFMGKDWDHGVPGVPYWAEILRVLKPGALLLAFGGTRTWHRLAGAIEDAGFELFDTLMWLHAQGFPKSSSISKQLDKQERNRWLKISKALDNLDNSVIIKAWKNYSKSVKSAGSQFAKSETEAGMSMPKNGSALIRVVESTNPEKSNVSAITAELSSGDHHPMSGASTTFIVPQDVVVITERLSELVKSVGLLSGAHGTHDISMFIVQCDVKAWQSANIEGSLKAVEALKIWLGSKKSSKKQATNVLCAALTDDLKHIISSRSGTFLNLGTTEQMDFVSAINVIITESTAANLISFMVDIAKREAIDKAAGAEREVIIERSKATHQGGSTYQWSQMTTETGNCPITAPATDAAKIWEGYGTSLKPAWEPILMARKPRRGTYAQTAIEHSSGALNIDECRVGTEEVTINTWDDGMKPFGDGAGHPFTGRQQSGRWPANLILDEEAAAMLDEQSGKLKSGYMRSGQRRKASRGLGGYHDNFPDEATAKSTYGDSGGASRFFFCAKSSRKEREAGLREHLPCLTCGEIDTTHHTNKAGRKIACRRCDHPTVKPIALCEYVARLIRPPEAYLDEAQLLVPFCGVASEIIGALKAGWRNITGIDIVQEYIDIAELRIKEAQ